METHIIEIVRFAVCIMALLTAVVLMIKVDDNNAMRRLVVALAVVLIYFNKQIGIVTYLLIGSVLETLIAAMGVTFVVIILILIMVFPLIALLKWLIH
jgi:hypothetical protein